MGRPLPHLPSSLRRVPGEEADQVVLGLLKAVFRPSAAIHALVYRNSHLIELDEWFAAKTTFFRDASACDGSTIARLLVAESEDSPVVPPEAHGLYVDRIPTDLSHTEV